MKFEEKPDPDTLAAFRRDPSVSSTGAEYLANMGMWVCLLFFFACLLVWLLAFSWLANMGMWVPLRGCAFTFAGPLVASMGGCAPQPLLVLLPVGAAAAAADHSGVPSTHDSCSPTSAAAGGSLPVTGLHHSAAPPPLV